MTISLTEAPTLSPPRSSLAAEALAQRSPGFRVRGVYVLLAVALCLPVLGAISVSSYFWLNPETRALRNSVMQAVPGRWDKQFAGNVGGFTCGLLRYASSFFNLPPEPKAALQALHGAAAGVYKLQGASAALNYAAVLSAADQSMNRKGWERIVGVVQGRQLVAVYLPRGLRSVKRMACCVAVFNGHDLVIASARVDPAPLLALAGEAGRGRPIFKSAGLRP